MTITPTIVSDGRIVLPGETVFFKSQERLDSVAIIGARTKLNELEQLTGVRMVILNGVDVALIAGAERT